MPDKVQLYHVVIDMPVPPRATPVESNQLKGTVFVGEVLASFP